jgi:hypothetical protein
VVPAAAGHHELACERKNGRSKQEGIGRAALLSRVEPTGLFSRGLDQCCARYTGRVTQAVTQAPRVYCGWMPAAQPLVGLWQQRASCVGSEGRLSTEASEVLLRLRAQLHTCPFEQAVAWGHACGHLAPGCAIRCIHTLRAYKRAAT